MLAVAAIVAAGRSADAAPAHAGPPAAGPPTSAAAADDATDPDAQPIWQQTLMAPRVTGNLRTVAVDPSDPHSVWVGTEEGTLLHSTDGGITWDERELSPFLLKSPTVAPALVGDLFSPIDVFIGFQQSLGGGFYLGFNPINRRSGGREVGLVSPPVSLLRQPPLFVYPVRISDIREPREPLLGAVAETDPQPYNEVVRLKICPNTDYTVFVATRTTLFASLDGWSFAPLFVTRESSSINDIACSPTNAQEVVLATGDGTFRSLDGGNSFNPLPGTMGPLGSSSVAFLPADKDGHAPLVVAAGRDVWIGDPDSVDGMKAAALTGGAQADVHYVAATAKSIWVVTESGVRASHDGGATWEAFDDLEGFPWQMVAVAESGGHEDVAILGDDIVFESIAGGPFHLVFRGQSRRRLRQLVPTGTNGFFLVTSGELWTTSPPPPSAGESEAARQRAIARLRRMPSLAALNRRAAERAHLSDTELDDMQSRLKTRAWVPSVALILTRGESYLVKQQDATLTQPAKLTGIEAQVSYGAIADLVWELPDVVSPNYDFRTIRKNLYDIRKRLSFVVEDAYDERRQLLSRVAAGGLDPEQLLTIESRIDVLDLVLTQLTGESMSSQ